MVAAGDILAVSLLGFLATCSHLLGVALGLHSKVSKRLLSCLLAFAAGSMINALAIELAYKGAEVLHARGANEHTTWSVMGGGFALGTLIYYFAARFLAAVRYPSRFKEYARQRKRQDAKETIALLAGCDLLRHLPAEDIGQILPCIESRNLAQGEVLFRKGDKGDALYIVANGTIDIVDGGADGERVLATLRPGQAFGEMAILGDGVRTASARAGSDAELLTIDKTDFHDLIVTDPRMASAAERLSHDRAVQNLAAGGPSAQTWARIANGNLDHLTKREADQMLAEAADGAGLAIVFGNILDTIPGCLVIGAQFASFQTLSTTLLIGMFIGGIPEAAASTGMLRRAGYSARKILLIWSTVIVAGVAAAIAGKLLLGGNQSESAIFFQAIAGGGVLALVSHAMIPEAIEEAGSLIVLPTVAGFLFAFYLALGEMFV